MVEGAAHGAADAERTSGDRRVNALHELANQAMDQQRREMDSVKRKADAKVRFHRGKAAAAKSAAQAAKGAARTYRRRVNENALTVDNVMRLTTQHFGANTVREVVRRARPESFASSIARHVNSPRSRPPRRRGDFGSHSGGSRPVARKTFPSRRDTDSE